MADRYRVYFTTNASASVTVEVDTEGLDEEEARDAAIEAAYQGLPGSLCAQCSGWREKWSVDLGEWEVEEEAPAEKISNDGGAVSR